MIMTSTWQPLHRREVAPAAPRGTSTQAPGDGRAARSFPSEFLNRLDEIIIFHALSREEMRTIIDIQLRGLARRLRIARSALELSERAKDLLIAEGYDPTYGARPLKRTLPAVGPRPAGRPRAQWRVP